MIERFRGMSFEDFAGKSKPLVFDTVVNPPQLRREQREEFYGRMTIEFGDRSGFVYLGDYFIAGFVMRDHKGDSRVWVVESHRRQGIAAELIYRVLEEFGEPITSQVRTPDSIRLYRRVYDRIQNELKRIAA